MRGRSAAFANAVACAPREARGVEDCSWLSISGQPEEGKNKSKQKRPSQGRIKLGAKVGRAVLCAPRPALSRQRLAFGGGQGTARPTFTGGSRELDAALRPSDRASPP
jgi:hypothetical protein